MHYYMQEQKREMKICLEIERTAQLATVCNERAEQGRNCLCPLELNSAPQFVVKNGIAANLLVQINPIV